MNLMKTKHTALACRIPADTSPTSHQHLPWQFHAGGELKLKGWFALSASTGPWAKPAPPNTPTLLVVSGLSSLSDTLHDLALSDE